MIRAKQMSRRSRGGGGGGGGGGHEYTMTLASILHRIRTLLSKGLEERERE